MDPSDSSQQPGGALSGTSAPQKPPTCDVKPRLTKEQHDVLEQHFLQQHKPSTLVKKDFASKLGVPLDKINNWFQNRRAKVKQDRKKVANQMNMGMNPQYHGMYQHPQPVMGGPYHHPDQAQLHQAMQHQEYHGGLPAGMSTSSLPVQGIDGTSALDVGALQQPYDMHSRPDVYAPNVLMNSVMAAVNGSYNGLSASTQHVDYPYDTSAFGDSISFSGVSDLPADTSSTQPLYNGYPGLGSLPFELNNNGLPAEAHQSSASLSNHSSPFNGGQANLASQSSNALNEHSVASVASAYSGYTGDPNTDAKNHQADESEDQFSTPYLQNDASNSELPLQYWAQQSTNAAYGHGFYQQSNISSQVILADQDIGRNNSTAPSEFEPPPAFHEDMFARRNSSTSNLAGNFEAIHIRNGTPDDFKQPGQPTSIAQRRKGGRPVSLNPNSMRSSSYSAPMPSPGGNNDHALRRIRSSGIHNAAGRIQKSQPGSAQRSPMVAHFSEAASSPKFTRQFSSSSTTTIGQGGGSLAPPTPLTPQDMGVYWQNGTVIRPHSVMAEHDSPESMNANWSAEPQSAGYNKSVSPPSTSRDLQNMTHTQYGNETMYRDSPPQSAPATQQQFPRNVYMQNTQMRAGTHSTTDLTIAQPKPSHFRRPSLPDNAPAQGDDSSFYQNGNFNYQDYNGVPLTEINHNVPFAPRPSQAPEFLVHQFVPPGRDSQNGMYRQSAEPPGKNYIFANQGPRDFKV